MARNIILFFYSKKYFELPIQFFYPHSHNIWCKFGTIKFPHEMFNTELFRSWQSYLILSNWLKSLVGDSEKKADVLAEIYNITLFRRASRDLTIILGYTYVRINNSYVCHFVRCTVKERHDVKVKRMADIL